MQPRPNDQSMEELLGEIRRIIAEESEIRPKSMSQALDPHDEFAHGADYKLHHNQTMSNGANGSPLRAGLGEGLGKSFEEDMKPLILSKDMIYRGDGVNGGNNGAKKNGGAQQTHQFPANRDEAKRDGANFDGDNLVNDPFDFDNIKPGSGKSNGNGANAFDSNSSFSNEPNFDALPPLSLNDLGSSMGAPMEATRAAPAPSAQVTQNANRMNMTIDNAPSKNTMSPRESTTVNMAQTSHGMLDQEPAAAVMASFSKLDTGKAVPDTKTRREFINDSARGEISVQALVMDTLQPAIKEWLELNLPRIVELLVKDEISRLSPRNKR